MSDLQSGQEKQKQNKDSRTPKEIEQSQCFHKWIKYLGWFVCDKCGKPR